jgi:hypothetical protein
MITIKLRGFDSSSGADRIHATATAVDGRGRTVGVGELGIPIESIYKLSHFAPAKLREWEMRLQALVDEIAQVSQ